MTSTAPRDPLLGEWASLGILYGGPAHGWAIVKELRPDGEIGRIWHLSRPLTYRALAQLAERGWIEPIAEERGAAGPTRTIHRATRQGRTQFRAWLRTPVPHLRDVRSELLLKLVLAERHGIDVSPMLAAQRAIVEHHADTHSNLATSGPPPSTALDVVDAWRTEVASAAVRFLDRIAASDVGTGRSSAR